MSQQLAAGQIFDGYRLIRFLGRGGFGEVWLCQSEAMGDYRALKFIPITHSDRLEKEYEALLHYRKAAAQLRSPHLVPIEHVNRNEAGLYYVMPLADGSGAGDASDRAWQPMSLTTMIHERAEMPTWFSGQEIIGLVVPVLGALQTLSDAGLVHRDVKPENILLFNGQPCLGDISLLGADASVITRRGTPGYATPSWYVDGHPDMYGVAASLYTLLTGNAPDKMGRSAFLWPPQGEKSLSATEAAEWKRLHGIIRRATDEKVAERYTDFCAMSQALSIEHSLPASSFRHKALLSWVFGSAAILIIWLILRMEWPASSKLPTEPLPVQPSLSPSIAPTISKSEWDSPSLRKRIIKTIPVAIWPDASDGGSSLGMKEYPERIAIVDAYENRSYSQCFNLLEDRIKRHPSLLKNPLCMLFKAVLLKHLSRESEIDKVLEDLSFPPFCIATVGGKRFGGVGIHMTLLESLGRHADAHKLVTKTIESALANPTISKSQAYSADILALVTLYGQRARVKILQGDYAGAFADEQAALALPPGYEDKILKLSKEQIQQLHHNSVVMQWEDLEQEFPSYDAYLETLGGHQPKLDDRNLDAEY